MGRLPNPPAPTENRSNQRPRGEKEARTPSTSKRTWSSAATESSAIRTTSLQIRPRLPLHEARNGSTRRSASCRSPRTIPQEGGVHARSRRVFPADQTIRPGDEALRGGNPGNPGPGSRSKKKAMYRAGWLALYLHSLDRSSAHNLDTARKHLTTLAAMDFNYKDVSKLLDKIAKLRENPESGQTRSRRSQTGTPNTLTPCQISRVPRNGSSKASSTAIVTAPPSAPSTPSTRR